MHVLTPAALGDNAAVPRRRLGVALLVPGPTAHEVDGMRRALGDPAIDRMPPHLTLVPPVNVRDDRMDDALAVLRDAAGRVRPLKLTLGPTRTFLPENPVVYLAVGGPDLDVLYRLRNDIFRPPLERKLTWPFVPHVTLADGIEPERVEVGTRTLDRYQQDVVFDRVHLLEEQPGHVWKPIAEARFEAAAIVGRGAPGFELQLDVTDTLDEPATRWRDKHWPNPQRPLAVTARRDNGVVGIATGWTHGELANLSELFVDAATRNEGVGTQLVNAFLSEAVKRGATHARLRTEEDSDAERFYRAKGWTVEATYGGIAQLTRRL